MCSKLQHSDLVDLANSDFNSLLPNKLPSNGEVLKFLFYKIRKEQYLVEEAIKVIIEEVSVLWQKTTIDIVRKDHRIEKLRKLYKNHCSLMKYSEMSETKNKFIKELSFLFDIGQKKIFSSISESEKCDLLCQPISNIIKHPTLLKIKASEEISNIEDPEMIEMAEVNSATEELNISQPVATTSADKPPTRQSKRFDQLYQESPLFSSEEILSSQSSAKSVFELPRGRNYENQSIRGTINVMTPEVVAAFDKCRVSYRDSCYLIGTVADALGFDVETLILNRNSFNKARATIREKKAVMMKKYFLEKEIPHVIVHWDGKIIPDRFAFKKIDQLPILVSVENEVKIIDVAALENQTAVCVAEAVYSALNKWGLLDKVQAVCADTTNVNFGWKGGAAVIFQQMINKDLLFIACRHHVFEIVLGAAFTIKFPGTSGPNNPTFLRFRNEWDDIQSKNPIIKHAKDEINPELTREIPRITKFIKTYMQEQQIRDDYKELLELSLMFLEEENNFELYRPGACHHARWMARAIYCLKMVLLRNYLKLKSHEIKKYIQVSEFIVFVYLEAWYTAPLAAFAPNNDLNLLKKLHAYDKIDKAISEATLNKLINHLWYLSPELSALSFFDSNISWSIKNKMVKALQKVPENEDHNPKKFNSEELCISEFIEKEMDYFIDKRSLNLFKRLNLDTTFLSVDCSGWSKMTSYRESREKVKNLLVVNDCSERAIKVMEEYSNILTKDNEQRLYLIQCVDEFKKEFADSNKNTIVKRLKTK